ncbi:DUF4435 domain-containing protein [Oscillatoria sp. FACHB-1406]|uniref:DUF4435 domain-containing protein n=1 Tax=Oscillatoria sp. FACHB-1406 TaxID=2692846 RepID=UPI001682BC0B|nr:DUF4435 domain-containing protein [Oscillatoria sp. FACHB-1406]MBD2579751.1 DUF4435 domain-containing protein [Oscillatoria sp. FACHB-1406]
MREFLSADREANAIRMRRSTFSGTFLLLEGHSDKVFYDRFIDRDICVSIVLNGKVRVIEVLEILENSSFPGILAIVDADFDRVENVNRASPNLLLTDTHDIETLLLDSPALDKVLLEFGSEEKIAKFGRDIKTVLIEAALPIGCLLLVSKIDGLNLKFEGIGFSKFIDEKTLRVNELKLIQEIKNKSQLPALSTEGLQQKLTAQKSLCYDCLQICCGHHLVEILSFSLRRTLGSAKADDVKTDYLERSLRLAYEATYFYTTGIYRSVQIWETNNQPFRVL